ncbi:MAG: acylphosphatase [Candidatus Levybacteria bacterium]|nr:acylphosphatase [Candidatus Levybacteria bacterium]
MIHVFISGSVQGVGFRQFVKSKANKLNVKGWVKNLPDRRVEAMLLGSAENLELLIDYCRKGPFLAQVKDLEIEHMPDQEFETFEIIK